APETPNAEVVSTDTVMPGLWDCHGHFMGVRGASIDEISTIRPQVGAMRVTADARAVLHAGFTSVREVGGLGVFLGQAIDEGYLEGPTVYGSGGALSMAVGHGDIHAMDLDAAHHLSARYFGVDAIAYVPVQASARLRRVF